MGTCSIFFELNRGFDAFKAECESKFTLRRVHIEAEPVPSFTPEEVLAAREKLHLSRIVFVR